MFNWKRTIPKVSDLPAFGAPSPAIEDVLRIVPAAPPLPKTRGRTLRVTDTPSLFAAARDAKAGTTILLADGLYPHVEELLIEQPGLTLRSESGQRDRVILDGDTKFTKMIRVRGARELTIADITLRNCKQYGIFMLGDSGLRDVLIHNCRFHNIWVRAVKGTKPNRIDDHGTNLMPMDEALRLRPVGGRIQHCLFHNDTIKPFDDDGFDGDYVSGMDLMMLRDWTVSDNVFVGIRGKNGYGRGAIFIWVGSEKVVAERNVIVNCDRGICFGNPSGDRLHMTEGVVRNNLIMGGVNIAIEAGRTRQTSVCHNTIWCNAGRHAAIDFYQGARDGRCLNNLIHNGRINCPKSMKQAGNVLGDLTGWFAGAPVGDFRLTELAAAARGAGVPLPGVKEDFLRRPRPKRPTPGALELAT